MDELIEKLRHALKPIIEGSFSNDSGKAAAGLILDYCILEIASHDLWKPIESLKGGAQESRRIFIHCEDKNSYFAAYWDGLGLHVEDESGGDRMLPTNIKPTHFMEIPEMNKPNED